MDSPQRFALVLLLGLLFAARADARAPTARERAYARSVAKLLGLPRAGVRGLRSRDGARGVRLSFSRLRITRACFPRPQQAKAFADRLRRKAGKVEVRGRELVRVSGRVEDARRVAEALRAAWDCMAQSPCPVPAAAELERAPQVGAHDEAAASAKAGSKPAAEAHAQERQSRPARSPLLRSAPRDLSGIWLTAGSGLLEFSSRRVEPDAVHYLVRCKHFPGRREPLVLIATATEGGLSLRRLDAQGRPSWRPADKELFVFDPRHRRFVSATRGLRVAPAGAQAFWHASTER